MHLKFVDERKFTPTDKVDQLVWVPVDKTLKILKHKNQKELLKQATVTGLNVSKRSIEKLKTSARYSRLAGSLHSYKTELENREQFSKGDNSVNYNHLHMFLPVYQHYKTL